MPELRSACICVREASLLCFFEGASRTPPCRTKHMNRRETRRASRSRRASRATLAVFGQARAGICTFGDALWRSYQCGKFGWHWGAEEGWMIRGMALIVPFRRRSMSSRPSSTRLAIDLPVIAATALGCALSLLKYSSCLARSDSGCPITKQPVFSGVGRPGRQCPSKNRSAWRGVARNAYRRRGAAYSARLLQLFHREQIQHFSRRVVFI